ncbi:unnamed protein product [Rotaria sordida]|uniref:Uncharacterized protein n=1 Tax=Rotaria sordida TaxID=392033 RepID=A0A814TTF7_9BILA|nr:unnamed protein product [Rotaria sordida]
MVMLSIIFILTYSTQIILGSSKDIIVERPFYLRARIHDSRTATVLFEIARETYQRTCQMYKFTIRRNREHPYLMPEQNLTFWRNSLELKHLDEGHYRVCAIICSEQLGQPSYHDKKYKNKNNTTPITACVNFSAYRTHLLILTLYILVFIILACSHVIYSLRKRQFKAGIKIALMELESTLQKWRTSSTPPTPTRDMQPYNILQTLVTLPASPLQQTEFESLQRNDQEQQPTVVSFGIPNEH